MQSNRRSVSEIAIDVPKYMISDQTASIKVDRFMKQLRAEYDRCHLQLTRQLRKDRLKAKYERMYIDSVMKCMSDFVVYFDVKKNYRFVLLLVPEGGRLVAREYSFQRRRGLSSREMLKFSNHTLQRIVQRMNIERLDMHYVAQLTMLFFLSIIDGGDHIESFAKGEGAFNLKDEFGNQYIYRNGVVTTAISAKKTEFSRPPDSIQTFKGASLLECSTC